MLDAQMKRGLIENCVLAATARGDSYGYKIVKDLSGCVNVTATTEEHLGFTGTAAAGVGGLPHGVLRGAQRAAQKILSYHGAGEKAASRLRGQLG
mgnify:CR=1 FL=1